ncbi:hypothetical protein [Aureimonas sp. AU4]|uniref:hypothetical protein n=1 Tax=Aureimonas sp. AU4 TaxID=1638163 RepID=UPI00070693A3|nr:hypothetical protein [Aureimonas sp. AU4]BAT30766.1 orotidine 5'-phosphate decarboxylase [Aureimonas sp. AU4]
MTTDTHRTDFLATPRITRSFVAHDEALHPTFQEEPMPPNLTFAALIVLAGAAVPLAAIVAICMLVAHILW